MNKIIVYSKPDCPACVLTKNYLTNRGVVFEERDITKNTEWREYLVQLGFMQLPVTVKEYEEEAGHGVVRDSIVGFNVPALDKLIEDFEYSE